MTTFNACVSILGLQYNLFILIFFFHYFEIKINKKKKIKAKEMQYNFAAII